MTPPAVLRLQESAGNTTVARLVAEARQDVGEPLQRQSPQDEEDEERKAGSSSLLSMRGGETEASTRTEATPGPGLLGSEGPSLDPAIATQIAAIGMRLAPDSLGRALSDIPLTLSEPPPFLPATPPTLGPLGGSAARPAKVPEHRVATLGDAVDALGAYPQVARILAAVRTQAMERLRRDWRSLSAAEKALVLTQAALIVLPTATAAMADPKSRDFLLGQLNGQTFNVPGVEGLSVTMNTRGKNLGVMATFDLAPYINW